MRSLLVFPCRKFGFHEERLSLAEKNRFASPQRRMAANRYKLVAENFFCEKFSAHWSLLIGINN